MIWLLQGGALLACNSDRKRVAWAHTVGIWFSLHILHLIPHLESWIVVEISVRNSVWLVRLVQAVRLEARSNHLFSNPQACLSIEMVRLWVCKQFEQV